MSWVGLEMGVKSLADDLAEFVGVDRHGFALGGNPHQRIGVVCDGDKLETCEVYRGCVACKLGWWCDEANHALRCIS